MRHFWACGLAVLWAGIASGQTQLDGVIRDFRLSHPDFEQLDWSNLPPQYHQNQQSHKIETGICGPMGASLDAQGRPVHSNVREAYFYNTAPRPETFAQWWQDVPGTNIAISHSLPLTDVGAGTYRYVNDAFFPIDNQGYGNTVYGYANHNYHFTMHVGRRFVYQPGQTVSVVSDDDSWVFIDRKLAIDVGGLHGTLGGEAILDSLGLIPGRSYYFDLFYAERNRYGSYLLLETSIDFSVLADPVPLPPAAAGGLAGLTGLALARRKRAARR